MPPQRLHQFPHANGADALRQQHRRHPPIRVAAAQVNRHLQIGRHALRARAVRLVHYIHVRNFQKPRLHRLNRVAGLRHDCDNDAVHRVHDVQLRLADARRFRDDDVQAAGVQHAHGGGRDGGQAAGRAARRHAANEHARIKEVIPHPDAIAQDRAARERAGRIDDQNTDGSPLSAELRRHRLDQRAFARARRPCDADAVRASGARRHALHDLPRARVSLLKQAQDAGRGVQIAGQGAVDKIIHGCHGQCSHHRVARAAFPCHVRRDAADVAGERGCRMRRTLRAKRERATGLPPWHVSLPSGAPAVRRAPLGLRCAAIRRSRRSAWRRGGSRFRLAPQPRRARHPGTRPS